MKNNDVNPLEIYASGLKGMTLAATMLTFFVVCIEIKEEWSEFEKVRKLYRIFNDSNRKDLDNRVLCSNKTRTTGKAFLNEIKLFKQLPEAQDDDLQEVIDNAIDITKSIIA